MKILLVGGAGFIGSRTALRLLGAGHTPVVFDPLDAQTHGSDPSASPTLTSLKGKVEVVCGDTRDAGALAAAVSGAEAVYYFPACTGTGQSMYEAGKYCDVNVHGAGVFADVLAVCRDQVARVIISSSRAVYGEGAAECREHGKVFPNQRREEYLSVGRFDSLCPHCGSNVAPLPSSESDPARPVSIYGITKLAQEQIIDCACRSLGISCVTFRYQNVYGEGQSLKNPYTGILSIFTQLLLAGRAIELFEDGKPGRDFVHVDDVVEYNFRALDRPVAEGFVANVGCGVSSSLVDLVGAIAKALDREPAYSVSGRYRMGDVRHAVADLSHLQAAFGQHEFVGLEAGVRAFVEWVRAMGAEPGANERFDRSLDEMRAAGLLRGPESSR